MSGRGVRGKERKVRTEGEQCIIFSDLDDGLCAHNPSLITFKPFEEIGKVTRLLKHQNC